MLSKSKKFVHSYVDPSLSVNLMRLQFRTPSDFKNDEDYGAYVKSKLIPHCGMKVISIRTCQCLRIDYPYVQVQMRSLSSKPGKIAAGATGRYIPYNKLPYTSGSTDAYPVVMVHWDTLNTLHAVLWLALDYVVTNSAFYCFL